MKLGFIGLGNIGGVMARRLVKAGHALMVHDLDAKAVASFTAMGATAATSARDVADIEGIVRRQASGLDVERIRRYGGLFAELKEEPDLLRAFEQSLTRARE